MKRRGGSRIGAGRKAALTHMDKLEIGAQCEANWQEHLKLATTETKKAGNSKLRGFYEGLSAKTSLERDEIVGAKSRDPRTGRLSFAAQEHLDEFIASVVADRNPDRDDNDVFCAEEEYLTNEYASRFSSLRQISIVRPYGVQSTIRKQVAEEWSQRIGKTITERAVERCWKLFRSINNTIVKEDKDLF